MQLYSYTHNNIIISVYMKNCILLVLVIFKKRRNVKILAIKFFFVLYLYGFQRVDNDLLIFTAFVTINEFVICCNY